MKLIIDIDEEYYNYAKQQVADGITNPFKIYISNGTPIPDNATNGDVIKVMFSNLKITMMDDSVSVMGEHYEFNNFYPLDFWDASYKKGDKE